MFLGLKKRVFLAKKVIFDHKSLLFQMIMRIYWKDIIIILNVQISKKIINNIVQIISYTVCTILSTKVDRLSSHCTYRLATRLSTTLNRLSSLCMESWLISTNNVSTIQDISQYLQLSSILTNFVVLSENVQSSQRRG